MTLNLSEFLLAIGQTSHDFTLLPLNGYLVYLFSPVIPLYSPSLYPLLFFKAGTHFIDQASFELIHLPLHPKFWD